MGKKGSGKDRLFLSANEWKEIGGAKSKAALPYRTLPFHCCALGFTPFVDPVCTPDGTCFDILNLVPYIRKYGAHPVSGEPLALKDIIK